MPSPVPTTLRIKAVMIPTGLPTAHPMLPTTVAPMKPNSFFS
jgi:hypothetical protein